MDILFNTKLGSLRLHVLLFISLLTCFSIKAQTLKTDVIQKKDGSILPVKVLNTTGDSIKYRAYFDNVSRHILYIDKTAVEKIIYKDGSTEYFSKQALDSIKINNNRAQIISDSISIINRKIRLLFDSINQIRKREAWLEDSINVVRLNKKKNIIKITPLAFALGYTVIGYERSIAKRQSLELRLGIVGSGFGALNQKLNQSGVYGILGYKINIDKQNPTRHILHGLYLRPEFLMGGYTLKYKNSIYSSGNSKPETRMEEHKIDYKIVSLSLGKQFVINRFTIDMFATAGYGFYSQTAESVGIVDKIRYGNPIFINAPTGKDGIFKVGFYIGFIL
jgi:hypothetical protein